MTSLCSPPQLIVTKSSVKRDDYITRLEEISRAYEPLLRDCAKMFRVAQDPVVFRTTPENLQRVKKASFICQRMLDDFRVARPNMKLDMLVAHIEQVIDFKRVLVESMRVGQRPFTKHSPAEVEVIERMASQLAAKIQGKK